MALGPDPICNDRCSAWSRHSQPGLRYKSQEVALDQVVLGEPERFEQLQGRVQVSGHKLSDPLHAQYPSSRYEVRCYAPGPGGEVRALDFQELVASQQRSHQMEFHFPVGGTTGQVRQNSEKLGQVAPKDHALQLDSIDMFYNQDRTNRTYFQQLSEVGKVEQFLMRGLVPEASLESDQLELRAAGYSNFQLHPLQGEGKIWAEDYSEPLLDGTRLLPGQFQAGAQTLQEALAEARRARFEPENLAGHFTRQGAVDQGGHLGFGGAMGSVHGERVRQARSYVEGGNMLPGARADGTAYLLVGQDSLDLTGTMLTAQFGRPATDMEVRKTVAADYGVAPEQVFGVEQPGAFHLDMRMTAIAPGVVALQDSRQAAELQAGWVRQELGDTLSEGENGALEGIVEGAEELARYEALTRRDLEKAGLKVVPLAGVFRNLEDLDKDGANFFNARHGTNPQGEKYTIMMGGTEAEEAYIAQTLLGQGPLKANRLYFLDPEQNRQTLPLSGGLKCRTKSHGRLAP